MVVREPIMAPERQNRITEMTVKHFEDSLRLIIQNLFPNGFMAGQEKELDTVKRLRTLMGTHDRNLTVILDPQSFPGDKQRSQAELFEEEELKREVFGGTEVVSG